jgi:glucose-1-phosphate thymidylyltransferase
VQAILLAGGHATRLWPITKDRPKPLLRLGERTILDRLLDQLEPIAEDVLVSTNQLFADRFEAELETRSNAELVVEEQVSEQEKPGALGALLQIVEGLDDDEPLLVAGGDNHYGFDLAAFVEKAQRRDGPTVAVKSLESKKQARSFGVVDTDDEHRVHAFQEKPEDPPSTLAATALYYYPPGWRDLFEAYEEAAKNAHNTEEMLDAPGRILEWAVDQGRGVYAWPFEAAWYDIGTAGGYLDALMDIVGPRYVEGELSDCTEGPGVYVFGDAKARRSSLERVVLLPGARVEDAQLSGCLVDNDAKLRSVSLRDSMVGSHDSLVGLED